ncbi:MAG TPA: glycine--tRNA ligase subunit alpha, partial [Hyphomonas sp.]|nr:glycine--tRNA ligase subunit alpha [Hyphomonas sp.]
IDARGAISPTERQAYIARVRDLARGAAAQWAKQEDVSA